MLFLKSCPPGSPSSWPRTSSHVVPSAWNFLLHLGISLSLHISSSKVSVTRNAPLTLRCSPICLPQDNPFTPQRTTVYKAFFWGGETGGTRQTKLLSLQGMRYGGDKKHEGKHAVQAGSPRRTTSTDRLRECEVPGRERPR